MEEVHVEGWKGKSGIEVEGTKRGDGFRLIEWRKVKETGEIASQEHFVLLKNVNIVWQIIQENMPIGEVYTSKYLARKLIRYYSWDKKENMTENQMMNALWGGKYRALMYFPFVYSKSFPSYPLILIRNNVIFPYLLLFVLLKSV